MYSVLQMLLGHLKQLMIVKYSNLKVLSCCIVIRNIIWCLYNYKQNFHPLYVFELVHC